MAKKAAPNDDSLPIPDQDAAAYRALALLAFLIRTQAENELRGDPGGRPGWVNVLRKLKTWLDDEEVRPHLSGAERKALTKALGSWDGGDVFNRIWRTEALTAILWALGRFPSMPTYEQRIDATAVWKKLPVLEPTSPFLRKVKLRALARLRKERERAEFWHWRARTEHLRRQGFTPPPGDTFKACIRRGAEAARKSKIITRIVQDDVPALGKPYSKLTQQQYADAHSVAVERHHALNWLCGAADGGDWDAIRTDT